MIPDTVLTDLDRLLAAVSPEPWTLLDPPPAPSHSDHGWRVVAEFTGRQGPKKLYIPREVALASGGWNSEANAALTVHARNHLRRQTAALASIAQLTCDGEVRDIANEALAALGRDIAKSREESE